MPQGVEARPWRYGGDRALPAAVSAALPRALGGDAAFCSCNFFSVLWFIGCLEKTVFLQTALGLSAVLVFLLPCSLAVCSSFDTLTVFLLREAFPVFNS